MICHSRERERRWPVDNHFQSDRSPYIFKMSWKCVLVGLALVLPGTLLNVEGRYSEGARGKSLCDRCETLSRGSNLPHSCCVCVCVSWAELMTVVFTCVGG